MNFFSMIALALCVTAAMGADLRGGNDRGRALQRVAQNGCWWQFHYYHGDYCVEKIDDPGDKTSDKVKFTRCDDTNPGQMWKFDKEYPNDRFKHGGLLYNMKGGCLAIRGNVEEGKNLKVVDCNRNNAKQHWLSDGDTLFLRDNRDCCVGTEDHHAISDHGRVCLCHCHGRTFLDYF